MNAQQSIQKYLSRFNMETTKTNQPKKEKFYPEFRDGGVWTKVWDDEGYDTIEECQAFIDKIESEDEAMGLFFIEWRIN
jgi:hypothetical protein